MRFISKKFIYLSIICTLVQNTFGADNKPKLTVIVVVDQFAYHYIPKLSPYLKYGLKNLMENGINYTNAYIPHGIPATGTGHAGLNSGAFAKDHGIIGNEWEDEKGKEIKCDDDTVENAAVIAPNGYHNFGKSSRNIMVDGLSEQFALSSQPDEKHHVFSVSLKSRAAIGTANKLGKAIWFDDTSGLFTSSKAYFEQLPNWVTQFNKKQHINTLQQITWKLAYPRKSNAYRYYNIDNLNGTRLKNGLTGTTISLENNATKYELFFKTPHANKLVFDLAEECVKTHLQKNNNDQMLLWVCVSSLDKIGHSVGNEAIEAIDMVYHLDKQLEKFIHSIQNYVDKKETLLVLTADHGVSPLIENLQKQGLNNARRIDRQQLVANINKSITESYAIDNVVYGIKQPNCYLNAEKLERVEPLVQKEIIADIKTFLQAQSGIKKVWTYEELQNTTFAPDQLENFFKQQLFPGRSGQLIIQTYPYVVITKYTEGSSHKVPYDYNTHVPLVIYQPNRFEKKKIHKKVWSLQLANTLADILGIQKPSASTFKVLPGIFG